MNKKPSHADAILPLLGKILLGTASQDELACFNEACKAFVKSEHQENQTDVDRFMAAEQIMELLVAEGAQFSVRESAELRHIFYRSENPSLTLAAMRKIKKII